MLPALALAQAAPAYVGLSQSVSRDSNLYRLSDGGATPAGLTRDDTVATSTLLGGLNVSLGRQQLRADASLRASRFQHNTALNHNGHGLKLGLDWATVGRLAGTLQVVRDRSLVRFGSDTQGSDLGRNLVTTTQVDASARVGLVTAWSGELTATHQRADYSAAAFASRAYRQGSAAASVRYAPGGATSLSAGLRVLEGRYPRFATGAGGSTIADDYRGHYLDLGARWAPSGVSQFEARWSLGSTRFDRATASDVTGLTGFAAWIWRPSGKLRLEARLSRDRGSDASALYFAGSGRHADFSRTTNALSLGVHHDWSAKITFTGGLLHAQRRLVDTRQDLFGSTLVQTGSDRTTLATLGARWLPARTVTLGCDLGREQRRHEGPLSTDYSMTSVSCFGQMTVQ